MGNFAAEDYKGPSEFVHCHAHSLYSPLDGVSSPSQYAEECAKRGYPAMVLTEHGNMASVPDMYFSSKQHKIKAIAGCEIYFNQYEPFRQSMAQSGIKVKQLKTENPLLHQRVMRNRHLTVLCKNETGFHNLIKLTTLAFQFGYYYKPRIWFEKLCEYKEGLIILSGCLNGPVAHELRLDFQHYKETGKRLERDAVDFTAVQWVKKFREVFGEDYYIEFQMPCLHELHDHLVFRTLMEVSDKYGIKPVLCTDSHYMERKDWELQKVMMAVDQGTTVDDPNMFHVNSSEQYFKSRAELWHTFRTHPYSVGIDDGKFEEMCDNTLEVADKCQPLKLDSAPKIPDWSVIDPGKHANDALRKEVAKALVERGYHKNPRKFIIDGREVTYAEQAKIELDRFCDKGFASYFLITKDLLDFGKKRGWPFGPRGSAGGSLVVYLLGIQRSIDPMLWGLSFDRFMSSSRGGYLLKTTMD